MSVKIYEYDVVHMWERSHVTKKRELWACVWWLV